MTLYAVSVKFRGTSGSAKQYTYYYDEPLGLGETVVVEVNNKYELVTIAECNLADSGYIPQKYVVARIDDRKYRRRMEELDKLNRITMLEERERKLEAALADVRVELRAIYGT